MPTIENLDIQISASASDAASKIGRLASALSGVRGPSNSAKNGLKATKDETVQAGSKFQKLSKDVAGANKALSEFGKQAENAGDSAKRGSNGLSRFFSMVKRIVLRRNIISVMRSISSAFKEGETNLYNYSKAVSGDFAASMDRLATSTQYLKNSLGSLGGAVLEALEPALNTIIDWLVEAINFFNMFVAALSGKSTYTAAVRQSTTWANGMSDALANSNEEAQNLKRTILGFDEINKLTDVSSGSGGSGGSGGSSGGAGMFEERQLSGGFQEFSSAFESAISDTLSRITMIVGAAELGLGAILALSGANVGLGLALMASGAVTIASAIIANWDSISPEIKLAIAGVETALGTMLAVGAVIAFSGGNVGLGIGLMIGALSLGGGAVTLAWNTIKEKMKSPVEAVGALISGIMFAIGGMIAFSGHPGVGIGIMIAAATTGAATINWNYLKEKLEGPVGKVVALISGATLALGILAILAGAVPIGLGLVLAGVSGLAATVAANWDKFKEIGQDAIKKVKEGWETVKELAVNAWVSLKKKVSDFADDVWDFLKLGSETIVKTVKAVGEGIATFATSVWMWIRGGAEEIGKTVKAVGEGIATFATAAWLWIRNGAEDVWKTVKAAGEGVAQFAGSAWMWIRNGAETVAKTVSAVGEGIAQFAGSVWQWIRAGAEESVKNVKAIGEGVAQFSTSVWNWIREGSKTITKTVKSAMDTAESWNQAIVDFILGPEDSEKRAKINMAMADISRKIVTFLQDPAQATKEIVIKIFTSIAEGAQKFWNWLWGIDDSYEGPTLDLNIDGLSADVELNPIPGPAFGQQPDGTLIWDYDVQTPVEPKLDLDTWSQSMTEWADELGIEVPVTANVETKASTIAATVKKNWGGLTDATRTLSFLGAVTSATSTVASTFKTAFAKLTEGRTLDFKGAVESTQNDTLNAATVFKNAFSKLNAGRTVGFKAAVTSDTGTVASDWRSKWNKLTTGRKLGFTSGIETDPSDVSSSFKSAWKGLGDDNRKVYMIAGLTRKKSNWAGDTGISDWWKSQRKKAGGNEVSLKTNLTNKGTNWADGLLKFLTGDSKGKVSIALQIAGTAWSLVKSALHTFGVPGFAKGGIINAFGFSDFANGGILNPHGTLFRAGENGAEVVGHIGGRTEVLNRSQLASTMYYSVRSAMAPLYTYGNSDESMAALAEYIGNAIDSAMAKDRELMRQQNEYLRQINDKEFSAEITTSSINQAQTRMNRRAGTTIVPVGT